MTGAFWKYLGLAFTAMTTLELLADGALKLAGAPFALEATGVLGFDDASTRALGLVLIVCTLIYAIPRTSILGAVLLTGFLGGAVAVQLQHGSPFASQVMFGVYVGMGMWAGLWLRSPGLRAVFPLVGYSRHS